MWLVSKFLASHCALWDHVTDSQWLHHLDGMMHLSNALARGMLGKHFFHRPVSVTLTSMQPIPLLPWQRDHYSSPPSSISPHFSLTHTFFHRCVCTSVFFFFFPFHFLAHFAFIPLLCVKHQQPSLVAATHLSLLAVMSALIVSFWRRRRLLWTDALIDFVLHWVKWRRWTDGWEKRL